MEIESIPLELRAQVQLFDEKNLDRNLMHLLVCVPCKEENGLLLFPAPKFGFALSPFPPTLQGGEKTCGNITRIYYASSTRK
jgi:hypothetical protein